MTTATEFAERLWNEQDVEQLARTPQLPPPPPPPEIVSAVIDKENLRRWLSTRMWGYDEPIDHTYDCLIARALREATGEQWAVGVRTARRVRDGKHFEVPTEIGALVLLQDSSASLAVGRFREPLPFTVTAYENQNQESYRY